MNKTEFIYYWLHIPTGKTGTRKFKFKNKAELLEKLNYWNRIGILWKYWTDVV